MGLRIQIRRLRPILLPLRSRHLVDRRQGSCRLHNDREDITQGTDSVHSRARDEGWDSY